MPIFAVSPQKGVIVNSINSGVSGPNVTKIVHNVEKFILFNLLKSEFCIAIRFQMAVAAQQKIGPGKTPIFWQLFDFNWLPWQRPLRDRKIISRLTRTLTSLLKFSNVISRHSSFPRTSTFSAFEVFFSKTRYINSLLLLLLLLIRDNLWERNLAEEKRRNWAALHLRQVAAAARRQHCHVHTCLTTTHSLTLCSKYTTLLQITRQ